ncbi:MAG: hypothetical protein JO112_16945 [Planctomycetes bacterium]|nr:hypothetical protein [Planctomycetota bacterium]
MCFVEIAMLILGIVILVKGGVRLIGDRVVTGPMARVIGVLLMLPVPIAFCVDLVLESGKLAQMAREGNQFDLQALDLVLLLWVEGAVTAGFFLIALVLTLLSARVPAKEPEEDSLPPSPRGRDLEEEEPFPEEDLPDDRFRE